MKDTTFRDMVVFIWVKSNSDHDVATMSRRMPIKVLNLAYIWTRPFRYTRLMFYLVRTTIYLIKKNDSNFKSMIWYVQYRSMWFFLNSILFTYCKFTIILTKKFNLTFRPEVSKVKNNQLWRCTFKLVYDRFAL